MHLRVYGMILLVLTLIELRFEYSYLSCFLRWNQENGYLLSNLLRTEVRFKKTPTSCLADVGPGEPRGTLLRHVAGSERTLRPTFNVD